MSTASWTSSRDSTVRVDGPRLGQALAILLADVAANTPAGQRIAVTADADPPDARVCVTGSGRLPDVEAFNRSHPEMRASGPARPFDFSLPLARTLVELNGGALDAESSETGGICFVLRLPVAAPAAPVTIAGTRDSTLDGVRILVVDDLKDARDVVTRLLQPFGAIVTSVPSVDEALAVLREAPIDLVRLRHRDAGTRRPRPRARDARRTLAARYPGGGAHRSHQ